MLHFVLAGAAVFLLYDLVSDKDTGGVTDIIVTRGQIEHMASLFEKTRQRAPTSEEVAGLIDNYIVEEILYREAKKIQLDQDDTIVRRRMRQKMEFLLDDLSMTEPSDENLQNFLENNPLRFVRDDSISFEHVYLADGSQEQARNLLARLRSEDITVADAIAGSGLLPDSFENASATRIRGVLGDEFATEIFKREVGPWQGPIESPFGLHLVRIEQITRGEVPALADIRAVVRREWQSDARKASRKVLLDQLRAKYSVQIEEIAVADQ